MFCRTVLHGYILIHLKSTSPYSIFNVSHKFSRTVADAGTGGKEQK
jgi:hypothetical protein